MFLKILHNVPLLQCLLHFPMVAHYVALKKFFVLWLVTSLPVILAVGFSAAPEGGDGLIISLFGRFRESISVSEAFVYATTFMTPLCYMIFEKYSNSSTVISGQGLFKRVLGNDLFKGYQLLVLFAVIAMFLTATAFAHSKAGGEQFKLSFIGVFLDKYVLWLYLFALFCWYMTLIDGVFINDYVAESRASEKATINDFSARVAGSGVGNE